MDRSQRNTPTARDSQAVRAVKADEVKQESPVPSAPARAEFPSHDPQAAIQWLRDPSNRNFDHWKDRRLNTTHGPPWSNLMAELLKVTQFTKLRLGNYLEAACDVSIGMLDKGASTPPDKPLVMAAAACKLIMRDTNVLWKDGMEECLGGALSAYAGRAIYMWKQRVGKRRRKAGGKEASEDSDMHDSSGVQDDSVLPGANPPPKKRKIRRGPAITTMESAGINDITSVPNASGYRASSGVESIMEQVREVPRAMPDEEPQSRESLDVMTITPANINDMASAPFSSGHSTGAAMELVVGQPRQLPGVRLKEATPAAPTSEQRRVRTAVVENDRPPLHDAEPCEEPAEKLDENHPAVPQIARIVLDWDDDEVDEDFELRLEAAMADISTRLQTQEARNIFVTHLRLSPEAGRKVLDVHKHLRTAIILAKPINFDKILSTCKGHLEYPAGQGFQNEIDEYSEADKRANLITETIENELLWKVDKMSSYQTKLDTISTLVSLMTAISVLDGDGEWGRALKYGALSQEVSAALFKIGSVLSYEDIQKFANEKHLLTTITTVRDVKRGGRTPWEYLQNFLALFTNDIKSESA